MRTTEASIPREALLSKEVHLEGLLPESSIELLRETNYRRWCGTNVDSYVPYRCQPASAWCPGSNSLTQAQKSSRDCLKDTRKHTSCGLGPCPAVHPRPQALILVSGFCPLADHCLQFDLSFWHSNELKISDSTCPAPLDQGTPAAVRRRTDTASWAADPLGWGRPLHLKTETVTS